MNIDIRFDISDARRKLNAIQRKQIPFATSLALNETANEVAKQLTKQMDRYLDRPTPFTKRAFITPTGKFKGTRSTKNRLYAIVKAAGIQNEYLAYQVYGGRRVPNKKAILVPTLKASKNKYGNITKATRDKYIDGAKNIFKAGLREGLKEGVYRRDRKGNITMLAAYEPHADYQPRYPFFKIATGTAKGAFPRQFQRALRRALATAR